MTVWEHSSIQTGSGGGVGHNAPSLSSRLFSNRVRVWPPLQHIPIPGCWAPWANESARRRTAPSRLERQDTVWRMEEAFAVNARAAPLLREAARASARRMGEAAAVRRRVAPSQLKAPRTSAARMEEAGAVNTSTAPSQLQAPRASVSRTEEAAAVSRRIAPSRLKVTRASARRMGEAAAVSTRAAQVSSRRHGFLQGAWEWPPLSTAGLHHCCARRHGLLHCAWRRPPLSDAGLHQVSCRRHRPLQGAWRKQVSVRRLPQFRSSRRVLQGAQQAVPAAGLHQASSSPVDALPSMCAPHTAAAGTVRRRIEPQTWT